MGFGHNRAIEPESCAARAGIVAFVKRSMGGGAHRGPVAVTRQRRTLRFVQGLLVFLAAGLLFFAVFQWTRSDGFGDAGAGGPTPPSGGEIVSLVVLGLGALGAAWLLQGPGGVRMPTPARLEELAGRAEAAAVERAEQSATESG
jgi:hypothetical protein